MRVRRTLVSAIVVLVPLVGAGCGEVADQARVEGTIELLDAGDEPLIILGVGADPDAVVPSPVTVTHRAAFDQRIDGEPVDLGPTAGLEVVFDTTVEITDDRLAHRFVAVALSISPGSGISPDSAAEVIEPNQEALDTLEGAGLTVVTTRSGRLTSTHRSLPDGADPAAIEMFDRLVPRVSSLIVAFPAEPIGPGARWLSRQRLTLDGTDVESAVEYTLEGLPQGTWVVSSTITRTGTPGAMVESFGDDAVVVSSLGEGRGRASGAIGAVLPATGEIDVVTNQELDILGARLVQTVTGRDTITPTG